MRFREVSIQNYEGIPDLTFRPGTLTIISGKNGRGKTSVIDAIRAFDERIHDPARIRNGAEFASVVIKMDDNSVYKMTVRPNETDWKFLDPKGHKITRTKEHIREIINSLSLDPIKILNQKPAEQVQTVLAAMPLRLKAEDLAPIPAQFRMNLNLNAHALSVIAQVRDAVYSERTRVNTIAKDRRSTIGTLSEGLPPSSDDGEWAMALEDVTADLVALRKEAAVRRAENAETRAKAREQALNLFHLKKSSVEEEAEAAIRKIRKDAAAKIAVLETERDAEFQKADDRLRKAQDSADKDVREKESGLVARKAEAEAIVAQQAKSRSTRELIERHKKELAKAEETSKTLTAAIDHLDKLKTRVSSESPIPGLDITPDGLVLDGVPFRIVNEAERTRVAFELAKILVGECKTIMIDNLEHLDDENKAIFKQAAMDSGLQVIAACVANHPLQVAIDEEAQVAHATV